MCPEWHIKCREKPPPPPRTCWLRIEKKRPKKEGGLSALDQRLDRLIYEAFKHPQFDFETIVGVLENGANPSFRRATNESIVAAAVHRGELMWVILFTNKYKCPVYEDIDKYISSRNNNHRNEAILEYLRVAKENIGFDTERECRAHEFEEEKDKLHKQLEASRMRFKMVKDQLEEYKEIDSQLDKDIPREKVVRMLSRAISQTDVMHKRIRQLEMDLHDQREACHRPKKRGVARE